MNEVITKRKSSMSIDDGGKKKCAQTKSIGTKAQVNNSKQTNCVNEQWVLAMVQTTNQVFVFSPSRHKKNEINLLFFIMLHAAVIYAAVVAV